MDRDTISKMLSESIDEHFHAARPVSDLAREFEGQTDDNGGYFVLLHKGFDRDNVGLCPGSWQDQERVRGEAEAVG